ncbi:hypothetical protein J2W28_004468 [Variovorax boronicumulans]|uniref:hypothetical protein n=1 Tax=Variovorax boronicumulans TaxID=436515 RepID=UPI00277FAA1A|nr:hypothetical protein [Variovorax boronicumulans]MDP9993829.1 hypothetical protein [Variovorax boronicumulans]MDQ0005306.1 hypothetical protein [Variovorax boronicumulans]
MATNNASNNQKKSDMAPSAKLMSRSRNQLATSYAPESFFTFEGGVGACIAHSSPGETLDLSESTTTLIYERMTEIGRAWFNNAMAARLNNPALPQSMPVQCVDSGLLNPERTDFQLPGIPRFHLCKPSHMEYTPAPLAFTCRRCGLFKDYDSLSKLDADLDNLTQARCPDPQKAAKCDWEQVDVIFVHWSGNWEQPFPGQWQWSTAAGQAVKRRDSCSCGKDVFRLNRRSASIGDWFFSCAYCGKPLSEKWLQNDRNTLEMLGNLNSAQRLTEVRMQATPYRASNAYYVRSDLFIDFKHNTKQLMSMLLPTQEKELRDFLAKTFNFPTQDITDQDVEAACAGREDCTEDLKKYRQASESMKKADEMVAGADAANKPTFEMFLNSAKEAREAPLKRLRERQILMPKVDLPISISNLVHERQVRFASKYDPVRLAVEHAALKETRLESDAKTGDKKHYVSFTSLDQDLTPDVVEQKSALEAQTSSLLGLLGMADMGLIRQFDLCKFSFGYSRMESGPVLGDKRGMDMPVRLRLFPQVKAGDVSKWPIYVLQQGNEALYVRLQEDAVLKWLDRATGDHDKIQLNGERLGGALLARASSMNQYLDGLQETAHPSTYLYAYTLLHSYAHLVMKYVSEYSGLDLGSLGEYIFPADLAFVVYRNGTTMDLGNLSAMWRNSGNTMLRAMLGPKATMCGTGSLCAHRGGACPDCIMVPETSCVAGNKLLSRSVLRNAGGRPHFDTRQGSVDGYLDLVNGK